MMRGGSDEGARAVAEAVQDDTAGRRRRWDDGGRGKMILSDDQGHTVGIFQSWDALLEILKVRGFFPRICLRNKFCTQHDQRWLVSST